MAKIPVTVLTGFLGAGKTTLLNRILTEPHGLKIAVIENEFGEVGIDHGLVIKADEEIFEMNNGCICCTVRGDLVRILAQLLKRKNKFDRIVVETTGLADPAPVAQTFFMDEDVKAAFVLDGLITVVDAKHLLLHLDDSEECTKQIAFADAILINKTDLVTEAELAEVLQRVVRINPMAKITHTVQAQAPVADLLDVGGFDVQRALEINPDFLQASHAFEWAGIFSLSEGAKLVVDACGGGHHHDHHHHHVHDENSLKVALIPVASTNEAALDAAVLQADALFNLVATPRSKQSAIDASATLWQLDTSHNAEFGIQIPATGHYALISAHAPETSHLSVRSSVGLTLKSKIAKHFDPDHHHDDAVTSVGIRMPGAVDASLFSGWISALLSMQGNDLYRCKGILNVAGRNKRYVFQGVHMMMDGGEDRPWSPEENRENILVFIGKNLNRQQINEGFAACLRAGV